MTIQKRLSELRGQYAEGERQMQSLIQKQQALRETMLRISGAIQVLEEMMEAEISAQIEMSAVSANGVKHEG